MKWVKLNLYALTFVLFLAHIASGLPKCIFELEIHEHNGITTVPFSGTYTVKFEHLLKDSALKATNEKPQVTLEEGDYIFSLTSIEHKTTLQKLKAKCPTDDLNKIQVIRSYLWSGNKKDRIHFIPDYVNLDAPLGPPDADLSFSKAINRLVIKHGTTKYPPAAKGARVSGAVLVEVTIDENGDVSLAKPYQGHPLLLRAATEAAKESKFIRSFHKGKFVSIKGYIVYNFSLPNPKGIWPA